MTKRRAKKRKRSTVGTGEVGIETVLKIAAIVVPGHDVWIRDGYELTSGCRFWLCQDGLWTGRFVYRRSGAGNFSVVFTARGLRLS